jgi:hypothetical protein
VFVFFAVIFLRLIILVPPAVAVGAQAVPVESVTTPLRVIIIACWSRFSKHEKSKSVQKVLSLVQPEFSVKNFTK